MEKVTQNNFVVQLRRLLLAHNILESTLAACADDDDSETQPESAIPSNPFWDEIHARRIRLAQRATLNEEVPNQEPISDHEEINQNSSSENEDAEADAEAEVDQVSDTENPVERTMDELKDACKKNESGKFMCPVCKEEFSNKWYVFGPHMRLHTGAEKPYKCSVCGRAFNDRSNRRTHEAVCRPKPKTENAEDTNEEIQPSGDETAIMEHDEEQDEERSGETANVEEQEIQPSGDETANLEEQEMQSSESETATVEDDEEIQPSGNETAIMEHDGEVQSSGGETPIMKRDEECSIEMCKVKTEVVDAGDINEESSGETATMEQGDDLQSYLSEHTMSGNEKSDETSKFTLSDEKQHMMNLLEEYKEYPED